MRLVIAVLVLLTMYLQYGLWYTRGGKQDVDKLKISVAEQKDEIARLKERNRSLSAEVIDLKQGLEAIEERARSEMGMIKNGEVFFRITDPKHEHDKPQNGGSAVANGAEPPLEPPLDPVAPGDQVVSDGADTAAVSEDKVVAVTPIVAATAKAATKKSEASVKPSATLPAKAIPITKPANKIAATPVVSKPAMTATAKTNNNTPALAKPKTAGTTTPGATSKTVTSSTTSHTPPRSAPTTPLHKPAAFE